jgi:Tol biopolymer transport system component
MFEQDLLLTASPDLAGTGHWEGTTYVFVPATPLSSDTEVEITLAEGVMSTAGNILSKPITWQFHTRIARFLYLGIDTQGQTQLFLTSQNKGKSEQLTLGDDSVQEYSLSPQGDRIAYISASSHGGTALWIRQLDSNGSPLLLMESNTYLSGLGWSFDGKRMVVEERVGDRSVRSVDGSHLWDIDSITGEKRAFFQDESVTAFNVRWSPNGKWMSYYSLQEDGVRTYNLADGRTSLIPSSTQQPAPWSPTEASVLVPQMRVMGDHIVVHLLRVDLSAGTISDLTGPLDNVEDGYAEWSPQGDWIAFTRRPSGQLVGAQVWLVRPDGSEAHAITNDPALHHGGLSWSPDGRSLLFHCLPLRDQAARDQIKLFDMETNQTTKVIDGGRTPSWLP